MKFPLKRSSPPVGNVHQSRKAPRPTARDIWAEAMQDEIDEEMDDSNEFNPSLYDQYPEIYGCLCVENCVCSDAFTTREKCERDTSQDPDFSKV